VIDESHFVLKLVYAQLQEVISIFILLL